MNDHNLDDLIIDHIEPSRKSNVKGFLTIVALAIVVMIVAIILTRIILKEPDGGDQALLEQNESEMISPDLTLQSVTKPEEKMPEPLKEETTSIDESKAEPTSSTNEIANEHLLEKTPEPTAVQEKETSAQTSEKEATPAALSEQSIEGEDTKAQTPAPETTPKVPEKKVPAPVQPKPESVPQTMKEQAIQKSPSRPANVLTRPGEVSSRASYEGNYYVQVGSFSNQPKQSFLEKIKNSGFTYTIIQSGGSSKLLIGPYNDRASVERALIQVRERINKNAFIYTKN